MATRSRAVVLVGATLLALMAGLSCGRPASVDTAARGNTGSAPIAGAVVTTRAPTVRKAAGCGEYLAFQWTGLAPLADDDRRDAMVRSVERLRDDLATAVPAHADAVNAVARVTELRIRGTEPDAADRDAAIAGTQELRDWFESACLEPASSDAPPATAKR